MRQRMLKAQLDLSVPCPDTQDFQPCMGPGCSDEGREAVWASWRRLARRACLAAWVLYTQAGSIPGLAPLSIKSYQNG